MAHHDHAASFAPRLQQVVSRLVRGQADVPVPWGKAMMWIFLLSRHVHLLVLPDGLHERADVDASIPGRTRARCSRSTCSARHVPLLLIAIMTFVLITSSGTMALAVNYGYRRDEKRTAALMFVTAALGAIFVGMQAFEWTKLIIEEGVRPWEQPDGRVAVRLRRSS